MSFPTRNPHHLSPLTFDSRVNKALEVLDSETEVHHRRPGPSQLIAPRSSHLIQTNQSYHVYTSVKRWRWYVTVRTVGGHTDEFVARALVLGEGVVVLVGSTLQNVVARSLHAVMRVSVTPVHALLMPGLDTAVSVLP